MKRQADFMNWVVDYLYEKLDQPSFVNEKAKAMRDSLKKFFLIWKVVKRGAALFAKSDLRRELLHKDGRYSKFFMEFDAELNVYRTLPLDIQNIHVTDLHKILKKLGVYRKNNRFAQLWMILVEEYPDLNRFFPRKFMEEYFNLSTKLFEQMDQFWKINVSLEKEGGLIEKALGKLESLYGEGFLTEMFQILKNLTWIQADLKKLISVAKKKYNLAVEDEERVLSSGELLNLVRAFTMSKKISPIVSKVGAQVFWNLLSGYSRLGEAFLSEIPWLVRRNEMVDILLVLQKFNDPYFTDVLRAVNEM